MPDTIPNLPCAKKPLRVIFAGTPEFAKVVLHALIEHQDLLNIDLVAVYTQPDRKAGRGQKLNESPVKQLALQHNIPVEQPESFSLRPNPDNSNSGKVSRETLASYRPDIMIVAAYGLILPRGVLTTPTLGCLNVHGSLLPRWRGAAPIQRAILAGDVETGITIMQMAQGLDTGDMLYKVACPIAADDTTQSLHDKLAILGGQAIVSVLQDLENFQKNVQVQDEIQANYAAKITPDDGKIDWTQPAQTINRHIRALNAYTYINGERVKILACNPIKIDQIVLPSDAQPAGTIVSVGKKAILVSCGKDENNTQQLINLTKMQWAGGKPLTAEQIANGDKLKDGDIFDHGKPL